MISLGYWIFDEGKKKVTSGLTKKKTKFGSRYGALAPN